ncbi:hypothetical protein [Streptomyces sp. NPDC058861]|uniref:hypothetical protein n=1 Tax=Streptomyces sp. NPDC058861 TaxID=3346653 RepID=UPI00367E66F1
MNLRETAAQSARERGLASFDQRALFPVTVTTVRREVVFVRPDGGPLTDGDFARPHLLVRGGAR